MKELIIKKLRELEEKENIKILIAVESGSRAWGFASPDSDYDVRFIYVRPKDWYLKLEKTRDVIELPINELLDINGWDLQKALRLLHSSNPTLFEWFSSPIVYIDSGFSEVLRPFLFQHFSSRKGLWHYLSMAVNNYREYLKTDMVKAKKYFYVLRPLLACRWILENNSPPPMLFSELVYAQLDEKLRPTVEYLLDIKMNAPELKQIPRIDILNAYIEKSFADIKEQLEKLPPEKECAWDALNEVFLFQLEQE